MSVEVSTLLTTFIVTLIIFTLFWALHVRLKDAGIIDIYWGPGFAVIAVIALVASNEYTHDKLILTFCTISWALRLGWYMGKRHFKSLDEDRRYAKMRINGGASFWWLSLFKIFLLQAVLMWIIATPQHMGLIYGSDLNTTASNSMFYLGGIIFGFGLAYETIADWQLARFKNNQENAGKTMTKGLWAYSRHPNYFGEVVLWLGLGLMGFALSNSLISFFGPVILTFLIIKVSGVSLLEKHLADEKTGYRDYIETTSQFIPKVRR